MGGCLVGGVWVCASVCLFFLFHVARGLRFCITRTFRQTRKRERGIESLANFYFVHRWPYTPAVVNCRVFHKYQRKKRASQRICPTTGLHIEFIPEVFDIALWSSQFKSRSMIHHHMRYESTPTEGQSRVTSHRGTTVLRTYSHEHAQTLTFRCVCAADDSETLQKFDRTTAVVTRSTLVCNLLVAERRQRSRDIRED